MYGAGCTVGKSALYPHFWFTASTGGGFAKFWSFWSSDRFYKLENPVDARD